MPIRLQDDLRTTTSRAGLPPELRRISHPRGRHAPASRLYVQFGPQRSIIGRLFVMGGTSAQSTTCQVSFFGHHVQLRLVQTVPLAASCRPLLVADRERMPLHSPARRAHNHHLPRALLTPARATRMDHAPGGQSSADPLRFRRHGEACHRRTRLSPQRVRRSLRR